VTIFISTHFMNKAARCDRISLMNAGRVPITDTSAAVVASKLNSVGAHRHRAIDPDRYASGAGASMAGDAATRRRGACPGTMRGTSPAQRVPGPTQSPAARDYP